MAGRVTRIIRNAEELRALVSPVRQEIVDVLSSRGPMSAADIAAAIGRPADALYFHLRALERTGLARRAGLRRRGRRKEALFRTVAFELKVRYAPASAANRSRLAAIVASMLRLGVRDFRRGLKQRVVCGSGPQREIWAQRRTARLTAAQLEQVNALIERLSQQFAGIRNNGKMYADDCRAHATEETAGMTNV
jgi:DNA-binding transcriptional ArsR family regulator